ncbi:MAG: hypothetical protein IJE25_08195 [Clostridia bacterium]|nr:hypothetical protein [Clostridia bacterium]
MGRENVKIVCPFYIEEPECGGMSNAAKAAHELVVRKRIRCEGLTKGGKLFVEFRNEREKLEHLNSFCESKCYKGCPVAQMLLEQYEFRSKRITQKGKV